MSRLPIAWNESVRLVISDVDETIAAVYEPTVPEMIDELSSLLEEDKKLLLNQWRRLEQVKDRVT